MVQNNSPMKSENDRTAFRETLEELVQVKNIPNTEFTDDEFTFGDYFDMEGFRESYTGEVGDEQAWVDSTFEPYKMYFGGVEEISWNQYGEGEMYWFDVTVSLPESRIRQERLARLVADAFTTKTET